MSQHSWWLYNIMDHDLFLNSAFWTILKEPEFLVKRKSEEESKIAEEQIKSENTVGEFVFIYSWLMDYRQ